MEGQPRPPDRHAPADRPRQPRRRPGRHRRRPSISTTPTGPGGGSRRPAPTATRSMSPSTNEMTLPPGVLRPGPAAALEHREDLQPARAQAGGDQGVDRQRHRQAHPGHRHLHRPRSAAPLRREIEREEGIVDTKVDQSLERTPGRSGGKGGGGRRTLPLKLYQALYGPRKSVCSSSAGYAPRHAATCYRAVAGPPASAHGKIL